VIWDWINAEIQKFPVKLKIGENAQDLVIRLMGGKILRLIGMDKFEGNRGGHPGSVVNDEKSYAREQGFKEVIDPAIANAQAPTLDLFTPQGRNHAHRAWATGRNDSGEKRDPDVLSWKIPTELVGTVAQKEIDQYRPGGLKAMPPAMFLQEWCGEASTQEGLVFPDFIYRKWPMGHLLPAEMWNDVRQGASTFCSLDYGFGDLAVLHWWAKTPGNRLVLYDEVSGKNMTGEQFVKMAYRRRRLPRIIHADPNLWQRQKDGREAVADQFIMAIKKMGIRTGLTPADNRFQPSLGHLREMMTMDEDDDDAMPQFMILEGTCPLAIKNLCELETTDYKDGGGGFREGVDCHAADSIRYGAMTVYIGASEDRAPGMQFVKRGVLWIPGMPGGPADDEVPDDLDETGIPDDVDEIAEG
jgi:hypothetical protein